MSDEKKLKEYAEQRLADYAGSEESLALLKEKQGVAYTPEASPRRRKIATRFAFTFSSIAVVVLIFLVVRFTPILGVHRDSEKDLSTANPSKTQLISENSDAMMGGANSSALSQELNALTTYFNIAVTDEECSKSEDRENACYTISTEYDGVIIDAMIAFDDALPEDFSYTFDQETTVADKSFQYTLDEGGVLHGQIVTDAEKIYILRCQGESAVIYIDAIKMTFLKKQ